MNKNIVIKFISIAFAIIFLCVWIEDFRHQEVNYLQSWDDTVQHNHFTYVANLIHDKSPQFRKIISKSIAEDDYNLLSIIPLSFLGNFFGTSRTTFILLTFIVYYLPTYLLFIYVSKSLNHNKTSTTSFIVVSYLYLFNPILLINLVQGQSTIDGNIFIFLSIYLYHQLINKKKKSLAIPILIGICLGLIPILHRWYSFYTVAFIITFILFETISLIKNKNTNIFFHRVVSLIIICSSSIVTFLCISPNLWKRYLFTDYAHIYQDFKTPASLLGSFVNTLSFFGLPLMILLLYSIVYSSKKVKNIVYFLTILMTITILFFLRIQDLAVHHYFLLTGSILTIIALQIMKNKAFINSFAVIIIAANFLGLLTIFLPTRPFFTEYLTFLNLPIKPNNTDNLHTVTNLVKFVSSQPDLKMLYFPSENPDYNTSTLQYFTCTLNNDQYYHFCQSILPPGYLSKRDKFPDNFSQINYFLIIRPDYSNQSAIKSIDNFITTHPNLYKKITSSFSDQNINIDIYKQVSQPTPDQISALKVEYYLN